MNCTALDNYCILERRFIEWARNIAGTGRIPPNLSVSDNVVIHIGAALLTLPLGEAASVNRCLIVRTMIESMKAYYTTNVRSNEAGEAGVTSVFGVLHTEFLQENQSWEKEWEKKQRRAQLDATMKAQTELIEKLSARLEKLELAAFHESPRIALPTCSDI